MRCNVVRCDVMWSLPLPSIHQGDFPRDEGVVCPCGHHPVLPGERHRSHPGHVREGDLELLHWLVHAPDDQRLVLRGGGGGEDEE